MTDEVVKQIEEKLQLNKIIRSLIHFEARMRMFQN